MARVTSVPYIFSPFSPAIIAETLSAGFLFVFFLMTDDISLWGTYNGLFTQMF